MQPNEPMIRSANREVRDAGATLFTLGGIGAAFGLASCCGLPVLLASFGLSSAWLAGIAFLAAPHRSLLLGAGTLFLAGGAALLWPRRRLGEVCAPGMICSRPAVRALTLVGLAAGFGLLVLGYLYA
jgi:mercuric ion transport protein